jgi:hypothetical protein
MGMETFFIVEASHLFRAGDKYRTQFFVADVTRFLEKHLSKSSSRTVVLHGSTKDSQAAKYSTALERHGVTVIRMKPIPSAVSKEKVYYKPTWYLHKMMGADIPKGSHIVFVGFHNPRYVTFLQKYAKEFKFSLAAFRTPSKKQGEMHVPVEFKPYLKETIDLDKHVEDIKAEFRRKK